MSHFTCFVIGDVDAVMEKYNEQDERYFSDIDDSQSIPEEMRYWTDEDSHSRKEYEAKCKSDDEKDRLDLFYKWFTGKEPAYSEEEYSELVKQKTPCFLFDGAKVVKSCYFANPYAQYDYYGVIGEDPFARWGDTTFLMKDGSYASHGKLKDLDIEGTVAEKEARVRKKYRDVIEGFNSGTPLKHKKWPEYIERVDKDEITIEEARTLYWEQSEVKSFREWCKNNEGYSYLMASADDFTKTEDEYAAGTTLPVFCANIMGEWLQQGKMGWFGYSSDEMSDVEWKNVLESALREAQEKYPDEEFHLLDCHI